MHKIELWGASVTEEHISSSEPGWEKRLAQAYRDKKPFIFDDDAGTCLDLNGKTLMEALRAAGFSLGDALAVLMSIGLVGGGAKIIEHGLKIPHMPTKVAISVLGAVMSLTGFGAAYRVLTGITAGSVKVGAKSFEVTFAG